MISCLTPNGTWHEHGVEASGTPCIWQDGLDIPFVNAMEANFYAVHPDMQQKVGFPVDDVTKSFGNPGLKPSTGDWTKGYSPLLKYEWAPTYEALTKYAQATDGSAFDGVMMTYVNPVTGGPVMQTIGASMQMLRKGERTKAQSPHRQLHLSGRERQRASRSSAAIASTGRSATSSACPPGSGTSMATRPKRRDACLFTFNDIPVMQALGLYREEAFLDNRGYQPLST